jgi:protein-disulfide isomerase
MLTEAVNEKDHIQGDADAPVTLVEYGDYECPHCGRAYPIIKRVQKHFGKKLRFVFRNFPLKQMHPMAEPAAETAEFADSQGKFWPMHDAIFENQKQLAPELLFELAGQLKLSPEDLQTALKDETFSARVRHDFVTGVRSGVNGTPTFFINGQRLDTAWEYDDLVAAVEGAAGD